MNIVLAVLSLLETVFSITFFNFNSSFDVFSKKTEKTFFAINVFLNIAFNIVIVVFLINSLRSGAELSIEMRNLCLAQLIVTGVYYIIKRDVSWIIGNKYLENNILLTFNENPNMSEDDLLNLCVLQNRFSFPTSLITKKFRKMIKKRGEGNE